MMLSEHEFDLMMAEALTLIGKNIPSLRVFNLSNNWSEATIANHFYIAHVGPESVADILEQAAQSDEPMGILLPSYLTAVATNFRRMVKRGEPLDRPFFLPQEIPEKHLHSYCVHLKHYGDTVCRAIYLNRFGVDGIKKAMAGHGCNIAVETADVHFEPSTLISSGNGVNGYPKVNALQPTVHLILKK